MTLAFWDLPDPGCRGYPRQRSPIKHDLSRPLSQVPELQVTLSSSALSGISSLDFSPLLAKCLEQTQGQRGEGCIRFHREVFIEMKVSGTALVPNWAKVALYIGYSSLGNCPIARVKRKVTYSFTERLARV